MLIYLGNLIYNHTEVKSDSNCFNTFQTLDKQDNG